MCPLHKVLLDVIIHVIYLHNYFVVGPNITSPPVNQTIVDPNSATFNCEAEGLPRPDISWFKIQNYVVMEITSADSDFTVSTVNGTGDRQIMRTIKVDIIRPALAAMYICNASNVVNSITAAATLIVHSKSLFFRGYKVNFIIVLPCSCSENSFSSRTLCYCNQPVSASNVCMFCCWYSCSTVCMVKEQRQPE